MNYPGTRFQYILDSEPVLGRFSLKKRMNSWNMFLFGKRRLEMLHLNIKERGIEQIHFYEGRAKNYSSLKCLKKYFSVVFFFSK